MTPTLKEYDVLLAALDALCENLTDCDEGSEEHRLLEEAIDLHHTIADRLVRALRNAGVANINDATAPVNALVDRGT